MAALDVFGIAGKDVPAFMEARNQEYQAMIGMWDAMGEVLDKVVEQGQNLKE